MPNIGDFVTANIVKNGPTYSIQGIIMKKNTDGTIEIHGESDYVYHCEGDATVVPDENLFGTSKELVRKKRLELKT